MVKEEYKRTEIGILPLDWTICTIHDSVKLINGRAFRPEDWKNNGTPIIRIQNLNDPKASYNYYDQEVESKYYVEFGDVLFAWSGTKDLSFGARIWYRERAILNQHIFKVIPDQKLLTPYYTFLVLQQVQKEIERQAHGFKSSLVHVKKSDLINVQLPIPPIKEQIAIAEALSDVDGLIAGLDRLIAKKRAVKQATMQQLLTGKTRLPGFGNGRWATKKIGEFAPLQRGFDLPNSQLIPGNFPVVYSNGIVNHHSQFMVKGPGVVTGRSGTLGKVHYVEESYWPHNTTLWVTNFNECYPKYVYYLYSFIDLERFASGSGVPTLNRNDAHGFEVKLPFTVEEQKTIADILSDMDTEITALEARRAKTEAIKQGMMQELLTGKTRLGGFGS